MNPNIIINMLCIIVFAIILVPNLTESKCNTCTSYGIACVNETSFNICINNQADKNNVFTCPGNTVCSETQFKCVQKGDGAAACESIQGCGICDGVKMFACTSRTTFAQCNGAEISTNTGKCPDGFICDSNSNQICVDECNIPATIECDRDAPL